MCVCMCVGERGGGGGGGGEQITLSKNFFDDQISTILMHLLSLVKIQTSAQVIIRKKKIKRSMADR